MLIFVHTLNSGVFYGVLFGVEENVSYEYVKNLIHILAGGIGDNPPPDQIEMLPKLTINFHKSYFNKIWVYP